MKYYRLKAYYVGEGKHLICTHAELPDLINYYLSKKAHKIVIKELK